jgi:alpha-mannosidase
MLHAVPNELLTGFQIGFAPDSQAAPQLGWELYNPLETMVSVGYMSGILPAEFAGAEGGSGVIVSALKKAEDGKGWIARAYASEKPGVWPKLLADRKFSVREVNMVESEQTPPSTKEGIQPFEIRTVRLVEK